MTTLAGVMLDVAKIMGGVHSGTSTSTGTVSTLIDSGLTEAEDEFTGGTLFPTSGSNSGNTYRVSDFTSSTLTIAGSATYAFASGISYSVAPPYFPGHKIKQAILYNLMSIDIPTLNTAHTAASGECTLSSISNVMRVSVDDERNYHWIEAGGKIIFDDDSEAGALDIWYLAKHAEIAETGTVNVAVNLEWLKWASVLYLWRDFIEKHGKDKPLATDLMAEARQMMNSQSKLTIPTMKRDPHYGAW